MHRCAGNGALTDAVACWDWCLSQQAAVVQNSWGGVTKLQAMDTAANAVTAAGALLVCSAGNDGEDADTVLHFPSNYAATNRAVISVGASTQQGALWPQSNTGAKGVTVAAPGVQMLGLGLGSLYTKLTGTSMAGSWLSSRRVAGLELFDLRHQVPQVHTPAVEVRDITL